MKQKTLVAALLSSCALTTTGLAQYHVTVSTVGLGPNDQRVTVTDPVASKTIIDGSIGGALYNNMSSVAMDPTSITIVPSVTDATPNPDLCDGFDIVYVFDNSANASSEYIGQFNVPGCVFGTTSTANETVLSRVFDWNHTGEAVDLKTLTALGVPGGGGFFTNERCYPDQTFSPLMFLHSGNYGIGVSVNYPFVDPAATAPYSQGANQYGHSVYMNTWTPGGGSPSAWNFVALVSRRFYPGPMGGGALVTEGMIPAHATRTYTVSVRIKDLGARPTASTMNTSPEVEGVQDWLELFKPYKAYFDARYKGQCYKMKACPDPVLTGNVGVVCGVDGFGSFQVDDDGYVPVLNHYTSEESNGWHRRMLWAPSGCFHTSLDPCNPPNSFPDFPFQFVSGADRLGLSASDDMRVLAPLADGTQASGVGDDLGLWWGHSVYIMSTWRPTTTQNHLDADDPVDVGLWNDELDRAIDDANGPLADMIGLDEFGGLELPVWRKYHFLKEAIAQHPKIGFIQETMPCDVLATLSAGYMAHENIYSPHYLGELLIPGHEFWGIVEHWRTVPAQDVPAFRAVAEQWAAWGFVPACFTSGLDITGRLAEMTAQVPAVVPCDMLIPTIYTDLPNTTVFKGRDDTSLYVDVSSPGSQTTFTWQKDTGGGWATVTDANATGINTNKLSFTDVVYTNTGSYRLKIEYGGGNCVSAVVYSNDVAVTTCGPKDYNGDGIAGDQDDIDDFFLCMGGTCCPMCWGADFDGDGSDGADADIEAFFRVLNDEPC